MAEANGGLSKNALEKRIREILKGANLETTTAKTVRHTLEKEYQRDLLSHKQDIKDIINKVINETEESESSPSDHPEETKPVIKKEKSESPKSSQSSDEDSDEVRKRKAKEKKRKTRDEKSSKKVKPKKRKKKGSDSDDDDDQEKVKTKRKANAFTRSLQLSEDLAAFTGEKELPRHQVVKKVWAYVKENDLYDPKNRQYCICDEALLKIFGIKKFKLFGMIKHLSKHMK